jgi:hypothetical protein
LKKPIVGNDSATFGEFDIQIVIGILKACAFALLVHGIHSLSDALILVKRIELRNTAVLPPR